MFSLPRGNGVSVDVPLASAAWESPQAVERLAYHGKASLFIGAIPASENWPLLKQLYDQSVVVFDAIANMDALPIERAKRVKALEQFWLSTQLADCVPIGIDDDRHFVTIAGSRSGKGTSAIIPNLCLYSGSVICLDPKGENATKTAARRGSGVEGCEGMGQEVFVLDPFGVAKVPDACRAGFNPLDLLNPASPSVVDDAALLAEGLIVADDEKDAHWYESARSFVKGLILHLITTTNRPNLITLRRLLTQGDKEGWIGEQLIYKNETGQQEFLKTNPSPFFYLLNSMRKNSNPAFSWIIDGAAENLLSCGERERGSILSTARRNTAFLDSINPSFIETIEGQGRTFSPDIFKKSKRGASLFLCLPAERMGTHGRWLRIIIGLMLEWAYRDQLPPACGAPVLFLLEEFYSLGNMSVIEKAAGYAAGFGVKLWAILQDLQQLEAMYPKSWQTFLANAGAIQIFGVSDHKTTDYISKSLGEVEIRKEETNHSTSYQSGGSDISPQQRASGIFSGNRISLLRALFSGLPSKTRNESVNVSDTTSHRAQIAPLLRSDEITTEFARETGAALLIIKGRKPIWYLRIEYYFSPWFWGRYVPSEEEKNELREIQTFGERSPDALDKIAAQFSNAMAFAR